MDRTIPAIFLCAFGAVALAACAPATVNKSSVRATQTAPESTQVDIVRIPYDANYPRYVVAVQPLAFGADGSPSGYGPEIPGTQYGLGPWGWGILPSGPKAQAYNPPTVGATANMGEGIAGQLVTALSNAGNIVVIDYDYFASSRGKIKLKKGEVGPFVVKGTITEFNEIAEAAGESSGGSLGALGAALGVAGGIAGNTPAAITGTAVALANPTYETQKARRTGSVAMDLKVLEPGGGRILGSVMANGSFTSESAASGFSLFGVGKASNAFAASALGQANRAAMNSATTQIVELLRGRVR
jgi:curli biogenesis system outer membrane secretion channel CsgG